MKLKMQREHDPEPERYYDWMLWKMRQLDRQERDMEDPVDDVTIGNQLTKWTTQTTMTKEEMYQREMAEMQRQVHTLQLKVKELQDKLNALL
tara:strand:- start:85 stop:360 length:276 start_codon:yes stop_codon:yes gene_type:complete